MNNAVTKEGASLVEVYRANNTYMNVSAEIEEMQSALTTDLETHIWNVNGKIKKALKDASGSSNTPASRVFFSDSEGAASSDSVFIYDSTNKKLGIGVSPAIGAKLHLHQESTANTLIKLSNTTTGSGEHDGFNIGVVGDSYVVRTQHARPIIIETENPSEQGQYLEIAKFQRTGSVSNTILNSDLKVNTIVAKSTAASVFLTHDNNTIKTRTAAQVRDDIGAAPAAHTHPWSGITDKPSTFAPASHALVSSTHTVSGLTTGHVLKALSATTYGFAALTPSDIGAEPAITGTGNKVLSIQADGSGVKTGSIYDNGNVVQFEKAFIGNSLSAGIRHYHDVYLYSNSNVAEAGILKIVMPQGWTNTFQRITIKGYNYRSGQGAWECIIGGYNYNATNDADDAWVYYSAEIRGSAPFSIVRLGYDGSKCVILLGSTETSWRYAKVAISDMLVGGAIYNWETGWSASIITSETGLTKIVAPTVNSGVGADWNALINKPSAFTPSTHGHPWGDITGKPSTFAPAEHGLVSSTHTVSGLTAGHVLKALSATTYGFAAITPADIGAPAIGTERSLSITTAGWVTIATCATGRAYGEFHVYDYTGNRQNFTKIIASTSYGQNNVSVIGGNRYSIRTIAHVRILKNSSDPIYGGAKLQVYCENAPFTLFVKQFLSQEFTNWKAWNDATPVAEGTPSGWAQDDSTYLQDITNPNYSFVAGGALIEGKLTGRSSLEIWGHSYLGNNLNVGGLLSFMYDGNYVTFAGRNASNTVDLLNIAKINSNGDISISGNRVVMSRRNVGNWTTISRPGGVHLINLNDYPGVTRFELVATSGDVIIGFYNGVIGDEIFVKCYNYNNPRILSGGDGTNWSVHDGQFFHFTCEGSATQKWGSNQYSANLWMKW